MNVIFIVIDTLRASRLGCYGYHQAVSPTIDAFAKEGVRWEQCIAPGIPTTPAHTTMFTGLHPIRHNIVCHGGSEDLDPSIPLVAERLAAAGYRTAAVDNLRSIKPWLARGVEAYIDPSETRPLKLLVSCEEINAAAIGWLEQQGGAPFYLFVHYWEPHTPYNPPERYRTFYPAGRDPYDPGHRTFDPVKRQPFWGMFGDIWFQKLGAVTDAEYVAALYDAEIRHVDDGVAELLAALDRHGLADDTLVVITGDHGESLYQHDIYFDHHGLYDDIVHVPLLMRWPGRIPAGLTLPRQVAHLDIAPTICEAAQADGAGMDGHALLQPGGVPDPGATWPEVYCCEATWQAKWAIRTETDKLIVARQPDFHNSPPRELFDLAADPAEERNIWREQWRLAADREKQLEAWIAAQLAASGREIDPVVAQGITLGRRWPAWLREQGMPG